MVLSVPWLTVSAPPSGSRRRLDSYRVVSLFSLTDSMADDVLVSVSSVSVAYLKKKKKKIKVARL